MANSDYCWFRWTGVKRLFYFVLLVSCTAITGQGAEECLMEPRTLKVTSKNCPGMTLVPIQICIGRCKSHAIPTIPDILSEHPDHVITSKSTCCGMKTSETFISSISCGPDPDELVNVTSAKSCWCKDCINS